MTALELGRVYAVDDVAALPNGEYLFPASTGVFHGTVNAEPKLWMCGDGLHKISKVFFNLKKTAVYVTEKRLKVQITVFSWPQKKQVQKLNDVTKVDIASTCFCRDGTLLAILADAPTCSLILYSVDPTGKLQATIQPSKAQHHQFSQVSFNPMDKSELCASGGGNLHFWKHDKSSNTLVPTEGRVTAPNVRLTAHAWVPTGEVVCGTVAGEIYSFTHENALGRVLFQLPTEDPVTCITSVSRFVVVAQSTGCVHFVDMQFVEVVKTVHTGVSHLRSIVSFPEWHSYYIVGRDQLQVMHIPGLEQSMTDDDLRVATPKMALIQKGCSGELVGTCHLRDSTVVYVSKHGILTCFDYNTNVYSLQVSVGEPPVAVRQFGDGIIGVTSTRGTLRLVNVAKKEGEAIFFRAKVTDSPLTVCEVNSAASIMMCSDGKSVFFFSRKDGAYEYDGALRCNTLTAIVNLQFFPHLQDFLLIQQSGDVSMYHIPNIDREKREIQPESLFVNSWRLDFPVNTSLVVAGLEDWINLLVHSLDKETKLYLLDRTLLAERKDRESKTIKPHFTMKDHEKRGSRFFIWKEKFVISAASDGKLVIRDIAHYTNKIQPVATSKEKREVICSGVRHVSQGGGISDFSVSPDNLRAVSVGLDGNICIWNLQKGAAPLPFNMPTVPVKCNDIVEKEEELFFSDKARKQAEDADRMKHIEHRQAVINAVTRLRERLRKIREENEHAADDEKVALRDFLVTQQKTVFEEECAVAIQEMTEFEHYSNLEKDYIMDMIRRECWDVMEVKLTKLRGMYNNGIDVHNFHQRKFGPNPLNTADATILRKLKFLRLVEMRDREVNNVTELADVQEAAPHSPVDPKAPVVDDGPPPLIPLGTRPLEEEAQDDPLPYLYNPLLVFTRFRAIMQLRLLGSRKTSIKSAFNKLFLELVSRKKQDIMKLEERNVRCRAVLKELDEKRDIFAPKFEKDENPSAVFDVDESEIPADKSTDPDEKRRLQAEADEKRRWIERHGNDDSADKALKAWMDGRLDKEVRMLDIKVDKPEFADETSEKFVPLEDRTDDHVRLYKEYEKALAKRVEEVTARRNALETEFALLQKENVETAKKFDVALLAIFNKRLTAAQKCFEVELSQVKLSQLVMQQDERQRLALKMETQRQSISEKHTRASRAKQAAKAKANEAQVKLDELRESEKAKEKNLRAQEPFADPDFGEQLVRLFTKKKAKKDTKKKPAASSSKGIEFASDSPDPFAFVEAQQERRLRQYQDDPAYALQKMEQPEGIPSNVWEDFQSYRNDRVNAERTIAMLADDVLECNNEVARLQCIEDELKEAEKGAFSQFEQFQKDSLHEHFDVDEIRNFRQGQVEVEQAPVITDYADAILVNVTQIERLNKLIRTSGAEKSALLREISDKRKEIRLIDWEIEYLSFCMQTLDMELRHLHTLRVTKQMQEFINGGGEDHNAKEQVKIHRRIEHVRETMALKIEDRKVQALKLRRQIKDKELENMLLMEQVGQSKSVVDERKSIRDLQSGDLDQERTDKLMHDMRVTRKLEDVAKAQLEEMVVLKKEIDRLRERTFPSFAVVSKRVMGNPDEL